jgi:phospholipase DDHD2
LTVPRLLESLGLEQYAPVFVAEEVDLAALALCTDADLKQMGLPLGPRKKLLAMVQMRR